MGDLLLQIAKDLKSAAVEDAWINSELIMMAALSLSREDIMTNYNKQLTASEIERVKKLSSLRMEGRPIAYITGKKEFWSIDFKVDPRVMIPRPETEHIVEQVINFCRINDIMRPSVLEIGTGCGCISVAISKEIEGARIVATDVSHDALQVAIVNVKNSGFHNNISLICGDLFCPFVPQNSFDIICSNPPYIERKKLTESRELRFEPVVSLDGGDDGLDLTIRIIEESGLYLKEGGGLIMEIDPEKKEKIEEILRVCSWVEDFRFENDLSSLPRVIVCKRTAIRR